MLVSASENPSGVPQQFIDQKEADLRRQREIAEELKRRQQAVDARFGVGHGGPSRSSRWDKDKNEAKRDIGGDRCVPRANLYQPSLRHMLVKCPF